MYKRKIKFVLVFLLSALAWIKRRALFLFVMEFLSAGGTWGIAFAVYLIWLLRGGGKAIVMAAAYILFIAVLWFSCISYKPHMTEMEYDQRELVILCEKLIQSADENYTTDFDIREITLAAGRIMKCENAEIRFFFHPKLLDQLNLSGIFMPFNGRAYINPNEKSFLLPYVACHELSHRKGILNEGQANIEAFLRCMESDEKAFRYSADVYALKYALYELENKNKAEYARLERKIPTNIRNDLEKMVAFDSKSHCPFSNYADLTAGLIYYQSITSHGVI